MIITKYKKILLQLLGVVFFFQVIRANCYTLTNVSFIVPITNTL